MLSRRGGRGTTDIQQVETRDDAKYLTKPKSAAIEKAWARHGPRARTRAKLPTDLVMSTLNVQYDSKPDPAAVNVELLLGWGPQEEVVERSAALEKALRMKK